MQPSTPTISVSVELLVFRLCFVEVDTGNPVPIVRPPLVWPLMFGYTPCDASTYHYSFPLPSACRISSISWVRLKYLKRWTNFFQYCLEGSLTLVVRNEIERPVLGLALLVANKVFATRLWKASAFLGLSFLLSSSTSNKFDTAALNLVPNYNGATLSNILIHSLV